MSGSTPGLANPAGGQHPPRITLAHDPAWPRTGAWSAHAPGRVDATLVGVPTSRTSLSPSQAHLTPAAVRAALQRYSSHLVSANQKTGEPATQLVLDERLSITDAGDCANPDTAEGEAAATARIAELHAESRLVLQLGGDNACTVPAVLGLASAVGGPDQIGLITIDAHHDLRDGRSNGSPVWRLVQAGVPPHRIVQIGIADFANSQVYRDRATQLGITVIHRDELDIRPLGEIVRQALDIAGADGAPVHVDVDVDVCDRSVAPGCPAALPGGIGAAQLRRLVRALTSDHRVRSVDFAEVDAAADAADGRTVRLVALSVLESLAGLAMRA